MNVANVDPPLHKRPCTSDSILFESVPNKRVSYLTSNLKKWWPSDHAKLQTCRVWGNSGKMWYGSLSFNNLFRSLHFPLQKWEPLSGLRNGILFTAILVIPNVHTQNTTCRYLPRNKLFPLFFRRMDRWPSNRLEWQLHISAVFEVSQSNWQKPLSSLDFRYSTPTVPVLASFHQLVDIYISTTWQYLVIFYPLLYFEGWHGKITLLNDPHIYIYI